MTTQQAINIAIGLIVLLVMLLRVRRPRKLRVSRLWIMPTIVVAMIGMGLVYTPHRAPFEPRDYALMAASAAIGFGIGWLRAKAVSVSVDPATREVTTRVSAMGLLVIFGVLGVRFALRRAAGDIGAGVDPGLVTDLFLTLAAGLVVGQRVELARRATRLLARVEPGEGGALPSAQTP